MIAHPVADLFPLLERDSEQFKAMVESIKNLGLLQPVVLDSEGRVLDGRNRLAACEVAGVEPTFITHAPPEGEADYAFAVNFARRDLTDDQRVAIAATYNAYVAQRAGAPEGNRNAAKTIQQKSGELKQDANRSRTALAEQANVSSYKAEQALKVKKQAPELLKRVAAGGLSLLDATYEIEGKRRDNYQPAATRVEQIKGLVEAGNSIPQVASSLQIGEKQVRNLIHRHELKLPSSSTTKHRQIKPAVVAEETVNSMTGLAHGIETIRSVGLDGLDADQAREMLNEMRAALRSINWLMTQLKEISK